jgi:hypothetical protein
VINPEEGVSFFNLFPPFARLTNKAEFSKVYLLKIQPFYTHIKKQKSLICQEK